MSITPTAKKLIKSASLDQLHQLIEICSVDALESLFDDSEQKAHFENLTFELYKIFDSKDADSILAFLGKCKRFCLNFP